MEASGLSLPKNDEERALKSLLDAFGSMFSLREIASAYRQADRNSDLASQILFDIHENTSTSVTEENNGRDSSESSSGNISENSCHADGDSKVSKQKRCPASVGTVSCVLGKDYIRSTPLANGSCIATKPLKLDSKEFPMAEIWEDKANRDSAMNVAVNKDIEDFLFKILGDGFQMNKDVIKEVLARCGYDMAKSMDRLLDMSAATLNKSNRFHCEPPKKFTGTCPKSESSSRQNKTLYMNSYGRNGNRGSNTNGIEYPRQQRDDLQKEVLVSLFNVKERTEESSGRTPAIMAVKRFRAVGEVVAEPTTDPMAEHKTDAMYAREDLEDDVCEDDDYQVLRTAVKEYRMTMKEYYKAAVEAFAEGDRLRSENLLEKGHFFHQKAREADEESAQKIFETRNVDEQEVFTLDLHDDGPKEAIRLLKCYLSSLSGIPSIKYLKIILETTDEDITKGARKRRIMKLLEKESIKWIEEGTVGTILIGLENINRKRLSFATKPAF